MALIEFVIGSPTGDPQAPVSKSATIIAVNAAALERRSIMWLAQVAVHIPLDHDDVLVVSTTINVPAVAQTRFRELILRWVNRGVLMLDDGVTLGSLTPAQIRDRL